MAFTINRFQKTLVALAVAAAATVTPLQAEATPVGFWAEDGGGFAAFSPVIGTQGFGDFTVSFLAVVSNSPGTALLASLFQSELAVINTSGATHTLRIIIGDTGFTLPLGDVNIQTSAGGDVTTGFGPVTGFAKAFIDTTGGAVTSSPAGVQVANIGGINLPVGGVDSSSMFLATSPYTITQEYDLTSHGGAIYNSTMSTTVRPVPEPGALVLFGMGLLGFGLSRRRKSV